MSGRQPRVIRLGDSALLVVIGDRISTRDQRRASAIATAVSIRLSGDEGWGAPVPSYASVLVPFEPDRLPSSTAMARLSLLVEEVAATPLPPDAGGRTVEIPTTYGGLDGPDLEDVANLLRTTPTEVVRLHTRRTYRVFTLGFAPGFAYLGTLPGRLAVPRLSTPRDRVPAGSVAIAGRQSAVYPLETPGGWRILGRTALALWDPDRPDAGLQPGDHVRFVAIDD